MAWNRIARALVLGTELDEQTFAAGVADTFGCGPWERMTGTSRALWLDAVRALRRAVVATAADEGSAVVQVVREE